MRIVAYPLITWGLWCLSIVNPWCREEKCKIDLAEDNLHIMIIHIVMSFVTYVSVWVAFTMTLHREILFLSSLLSTAAALIVYFVLNKFNTSFIVKNYRENDPFSDHLKMLLFVAGLLLWLGEFFGKRVGFSCKKNIILAKDKDMFLTPHYHSVFLDQHLILNRHVSKTKSKIESHSQNFRTIFICSTMYHESHTEMNELLTSLRKVAEDSKSGDKYESHIFFDGAVNSNHIENFGLQLLSLLCNTLNVKLKDGCKTKTPYGYKFHWTIKKSVEIPFYIHFKDKNFVKAKKRWSQVMYMSYILQHWKKPKGVSLDDMFILTTDGDVEFSANSVEVLLDRLESNSKVAGVCARTHPKGHGPLYWYQLFDYAIGHWFQKPAEHILGSVLCSPGCFSISRCSALNQVLQEYSSEVHDALEFLMKDMGEDRWLCTLLIKEGLRLEYCAISENFTHCPTSFNEFFKQRRRWIPSTIANIVTLILKSGSIMKQNDSISFPFILFQLVMIFSLAISPATVILVIAAGLETFDIPYQATVPILFILSAIYALVCYFASPKAQLHVSKILTFLFVLVMAVVIVGIFKDIVDSIVGEQPKILIEPSNCDNFIVGGNETSEYFMCMKANSLIANYTNGKEYHHLKLPVPMTVVYIAALAGTFFIASVFHFSEMYCILNSIWFLLGLPSGLLYHYFKIIYSIYSCYLRILATSNIFCCQSL